jgi:hypothetical protein
MNWNKEMFKLIVWGNTVLIVAKVSITVQMWAWERIDKALPWGRGA